MWKYSFNLVTKELELVKKKKQALDELMASNRISQSTYDYLSGELAEALSDLEGYLKSLKDKMTVRAQELEKQINTLELFLAKLEIYHATGEINDEAYEKQRNAILLGIETTKKELSEVKNSLSVSISEPVETPTAPEVTETEESTESVESEAPTLTPPSEQTTT